MKHAITLGIIIFIVANIVLLGVSYGYVQSQVSLQELSISQQVYYQKKEEELQLKKDILAQSTLEVEQNIHSLQAEIASLEQQQQELATQEQSANQQIDYYQNQISLAQNKQDNYVTQIKQIKTLIAQQKAAAAAAARRRTRSS